MVMAGRSVHLTTLFNFFPWASLNKELTNILRKTIEGYQNSFDYLTVEKIIYIQGIFVSDRTINIQFSRMQNKIYGSLVTIQYHTKCTNPLYPKFTSKKISVCIFCCNLYLAITYVLILTTDKCSHPFISNCT